MPAHAWFMGLVILAYALGAAFYFATVFFGVANAARTGRLILIVGASLQGIALAGHWIARGAFMFANVFEAASLVVWLVVVVFLLVEHKAHVTAAGVFVTPLAVLISVSALAFHENKGGAENVDSLWILAHVGVIILGYTALALAVCSALLYLTGEKLLKEKQMSGLLRYFPSLETADRQTVQLTAFGLSMLTAGIVTGVLRAYAMDHSSPWTERRLVLSLIAWIFFAAYLFVRKVIGWQGSRAKWVIVVGFAVLIVTLVSYRFAA